MIFLMWAGGLKQAAEIFKIALEILNCAAYERFYNFFVAFECELEVGFHPRLVLTPEC